MGRTTNWSDGITISNEMIKQLQTIFKHSYKRIKEASFKNLYPIEHKWIVENINFHDKMTFSERKYCIMNDIKEIPKCLHCDKNLKYKQSSYGLFCNNNCSQKSSYTKNRRKQTCQKNFGSNSPFTSTEIKKKMKASMIDKYGVENISHHPNTLEKIKNTNLERYGVENYSQTEQSKENYKKFLKSYWTKENKEKHSKLITKLYKDPKWSNSKKHKKELAVLKQYEEKYPNLYVIRDKELLLKQFKIHNTNSRTILAMKLGLKHTMIDYAMVKFDINNMYRSSKSSKEEYICQFLEENNIKIIRTDRTIIKPHELDIYLPDHKIAIEFNGNYWHSFKDQFYHLKKSMKCRENDVRLIHIFEYEFDDEMLDWLLDQINNKTKIEKCPIIIQDLSKDAFDYSKLGYIYESLILPTKINNVYNCGYIKWIYK